MNTIQLRGVTLGVGRPKICVPLTGGTEAELLAEIGAAKTARADLVEWRADYFADVTAPPKVIKTLEAMRRALGETPLLFTFRTAGEGGVTDIGAANYRTLCTAVAESRNADAMDVELALGDGAVTRVLESVHKNGVVAVVSSHNFTRTPDRAEILARLAKMRELGGDLPKVAVMPNRFADVLELMAATDEFVRKEGGPVVTMSMGRLGGISRVAGEFYGSCLTFGSVNRASAPGQLAVADLSTVLDILH